MLSKTWTWSSVLIALLVAAASLCGIYDPTVYAEETPNWRLQAIAQDIGNLIAVPVFLAGLYYCRQGSVRAFLIWMGALLYFIYAYLLYAFAVHFNYLFLVYVAALGLSVYSLLGGILEADLSKFSPALPGKHTKIAGILLIATGVLFGLLWLAEIIPAMISGENPESAAAAGLWVNPVHVIDLSLVLPGMVATGILLGKQKTMGYLFAAPWLTFSVLMGSSILVNFIMELRKGNTEVMPPMLVVSLIVLSSVLALYFYLKELKLRRRE